MNIKDALEKNGLHLINDGNFWRAKAVFRNGKNQTSLRINKKNGNFIDFGSNTSGNLKKLISLINGENFNESDFEKIEYNISNEEEKPTINMEKTWDIKELDKIIPHHDFYLKRGISLNTLKKVQSGFCHEGDMYSRYVFPIFRKDGVIHGWSGRDLINRQTMKWKHIGSKRNWIYPLYLYEKRGSKKYFFVENSIKEKSEVILVESIGDMLSLFERGYYNVLVLFGLKISNKLALEIMSLNPKKIIIATNNDFSKEINSGKNGALSTYFELVKYVDFQKIIISLPVNSNDFGEINDENFKHWEENNKKFDLKNTLCDAIKYGIYLKNNQKLNKDLLKIASSIYDFYKTNYLENV